MVIKVKFEREDIALGINMNYYYIYNGSYVSKTFTQELHGKILVSKSMVWACINTTGWMRFPSNTLCIFHIPEQFTRLSYGIIFFTNRFGQWPWNILSVSITTLLISREPFLQRNYGLVTSSFVDIIHMTTPGSVMHIPPLQIYRIFKRFPNGNLVLGKWNILENLLCNPANFEWFTISIMVTPAPIFMQFTN